MGGLGHTYHSVYFGGQRTTWSNQFSFHCVGPGDETQVTRLGDKYPFFAELINCQNPDSSARTSGVPGLQACVTIVCLCSVLHGW